MKAASRFLIDRSSVRSWPTSAAHASAANDRFGAASCLSVSPFGGGHPASQQVGIDRALKCRYGNGRPMLAAGCYRFGLELITVPPPARGL